MHYKLASQTALSTIGQSTRPKFSVQRADLAPAFAHYFTNGTALIFPLTF